MVVRHNLILVAIKKINNKKIIKTCLVQYHMKGFTIDHIDCWPVLHFHVFYFLKLKCVLDYIPVFCVDWKENNLTLERPLALADKRT